MIIWGLNDGDNTPGRGKAIAEHLRYKNIIPRRLLDVACGNGSVLREIKEYYPDIEMLGVDIQDFSEWNKTPNMFKKIPLQDFIRQDTSTWDIVLMLNTYRNWSGHEKVAFDDWLKRHAVRFITSIEANYIAADTHGFPMLLFKV